jgi:hypothetical protein
VGTFLILAALHAPSPRPAVGFSWGKWDRPVGFEVEYASSVGDAPGKASVGSISANLLVDTPVRIRKARLYGLAGFGLFGESGGRRGSSGEVEAKVLGAGLKMPLAGSLKFRVDYRVFFGAAPDASPAYGGSVRARRLAAGVSVGF